MRRFRHPALFSAPHFGRARRAPVTVVALAQPASRLSSIGRLFGVGALAAAVFAASSAIGAMGAEGGPGVPVRAGAEAAPKTSGHWVDSWVSMPQLTEPNNMPPPPFTQNNLVLADATLRQTIRASVGSKQMRLRFSNAFGGAALPITRVSVALPAGGQAGVSAIQPGTTQPVTFHGRSSVVIPVGAQMVS